ncbi:hypothetical protein EPN42_04690 [bacterium]|nr:MAG: hypothetical protein EPN42_04690 [bacterium]
MPDSESNQLPCCVHPHDAAWVLGILDGFPDAWRRRALDRYVAAHRDAQRGATGTDLQRAAAARRAANLTLLDIQEAAQAALSRRAQEALTMEHHPQEEQPCETIKLNESTVA